MWQKPLKKTIFVLNVDNYGPAIREVTYPLIKHYAKKIGADFYEIKKRKFPKWPPVYEKLQIYELAQKMGNDWNIYIDSDALIHPDLIDLTNHIPRNTVAHNGSDVADTRWVYDRFFRRDGRHISSCNWFTIASDWCIELWKPLEDLTRQQAVRNIYPTVNELNTVVTASHLIDDYVLSRNIAKYGLKFMTFHDVFKGLGWKPNLYLWHTYTSCVEAKVIELKKVLKSWNVA